MSFFVGRDMLLARGEHNVAPASRSGLSILTQESWLALSDLRGSFSPSRICLILALPQLSHACVHLLRCGEHRAPKVPSAAPVCLLLNMHGHGLVFSAARHSDSTIADRNDRPMHGQLAYGLRSNG